MSLIDDDLVGTPANALVFSKAGFTKNVGEKAKNAFREEVKKVMFGFGDSKNPDERSVELLEVYIDEFIVNLVTQASRRSQRHNSNSLRLADVLHTIRKDEKKFLRIPYIVTAQR